MFYQIMDAIDIAISIIAVIAAIIMVIGFVRMCRGKNGKLFTVSATIVAVCLAWNVCVR